MELRLPAHLCAPLVRRDDSSDRWPQVETNRPKIVWLTTSPARKSAVNTRLATRLRVIARATLTPPARICALLQLRICTRGWLSENAVRALRCLLTRVISIPSCEWGDSGE